MVGVFQYSSGGLFNSTTEVVDLTTSDQEIRFDTEEDEAAFGSSRSYRDLFKEQVYKLKQNYAYFCYLKVHMNMSEDVCDRIGFYLWRNSYIRNVTLSSCCLCEEKMKRLFSRIVDQHEQNESNDYLKRHDILERMFNVGDTSLTGRVMGYLSINPFSTLLHVDLTDNNFGTNGLDVLVKAIAGAPVRELHLRRCGVNDLSPFITGGRNLKELRLLDLNYNCLDSTMANSRALSVIFDDGHPRPRVLSLRDCGINSELMKMAAPALSSNRTLQYLHLFENPLEDRGIEALIKVYCDWTSFDKILSSNHTILKVSVGGSDSRLERSASEGMLRELSLINLLGHGKEERSLVACRKFFTLLSYRDDVDPSTFGYFDIGIAPLIFFRLLNRSSHEELRILTAAYKILKCKSFRERLKLRIDHDVLRKTEEEVRMKNEQLEADNAALLEENRRLKEQIALLMGQNGTGAGSQVNYSEAEQNVGSIAERVKMRAKRRKLGKL